MEVRFNQVAKGLREVPVIPSRYSNPQRPMETRADARTHTHTSRQPSGATPTSLPRSKRRDPAALPFPPAQHTSLRCKAVLTSRPRPTHHSLGPSVTQRPPARADLGGGCRPEHSQVGEVKERGEGEEEKGRGPQPGQGGTCPSAAVPAACPTPECCITTFSAPWRHSTPPEPEGPRHRSVFRGA